MRILNFFLISIILSTTFSAQALDKDVLNFCRGNVDLKENSFNIFISSDLAKVEDVLKVLNIVGGMSHAVGLAVKDVGFKANFAQTSIEEQLRLKHTASILVVELITEGVSSDYLNETLKPGALKLLDAVSKLNGFEVACTSNMATSK